MTTHRRRLSATAALIVVFGFLFSSLAFAKDNPSITQIGHSIVVNGGQKTGELTCLGCNIYVRGAEVAGDVTAVGGSIIIEDQSEITGDVTGLAGDVRVGRNVSISGDLTAVGGQVRRDPDSKIAGDVTSLGGHGWIVLIFGLPLILLGLLIAFAVWLVQRAHRPAVPAQAV